VTGPLRSPWVVAASLILWSVVLYVAERAGTRERGQDDLRLTDAVLVGVAQCVALVPGVPDRVPRSVPGCYAASTA
jgi:undecaprenyl-diphosphatase